MATKHTYNVAAGAVVKITNTYKKPEVDALGDLNPIEDGLKFNTGKASLGNPYIDEAADLTSGKVLVEDKTAWKSAHIASIRMYKSNSYVNLYPGDSISITARSAEEAMYYITMKSELITVDAGEADQTSKIEETEAEFDTYLDRTSNIGGEAGINFESDVITDKMEGREPSSSAEGQEPSVVAEGEHA